VRSHDSLRRVITESADKHLSELEKGYERVLDAIAPGEHFDSSKADISLSIRIVHFKGYSVLALLEEDLKVLDLCVGEEDGLRARPGALVLWGD
jgi:hypothetical protein